MSQESLAHLAGLDRTYISMIERRKRSPTIDVIEKIARALQVSNTALIAESDNPPEFKNPPKIHKRQPTSPFNAAAITQSRNQLRHFSFILETDLAELSSFAHAEFQADMSPGDIISTINAPFWGAIFPTYHEIQLQEAGDIKTVYDSVKSGLKNALNSLGYDTDISSMKPADLDFMLTFLTPPRSHHLVGRVEELANVTIAQELRRNSELKLNIWPPISNIQTVGNSHNHLNLLSELLRHSISDKTPDIAIHNLPISLYFWYLSIDYFTINAKPHRAVVSPRMTYSKHLFREFMRVYTLIYEEPPIFSGRNRGPDGPATQWFKRLLRLAAARFMPYYERTIADATPSTQIWLRAIKDGILDADQLSAGTISKNLRSAWKHVAAESARRT